MIRTNWTITSESNWGIREDYLFTYDEEEKQQNEVNRNNANLILNPKFIPVSPIMIRWGYSYLEAILYWFIDFFLCYNDRFYCTNEQLWEMLWVSEKTISLAIKKLIDDWLIEVSYKIKSGGWKIRFLKNVNSDFTKMYSQTLQKGKGIYNNIIDNNKNTKNSIKQSTRTQGKHWSDGLTLSENVMEWLVEYNNIRKKKLEKLTDKWIQLVINKLQTLWHWTDEWMIAVLKQSIENGWEWLFEVKWFKPTVNYESDLWAFYNEMKRDYEWLKNKLWVEKFMQLKQKALRYAAENKLL